MSRPRGLRSLGAAVIACTAAMVGSFLVVPSASADVPSPAATAFDAPLCPGMTDDDPRSATGAVPDLTRVFGQRLTDYNAGEVVVLYDAFGDNSLDGYPALCGTRYVEGTGPVSEWMFCTDIFSHVCSGTDAAGNLLDIDGNVIPGLGPVAGNPRLSLTPDKEKLIAWLIRNGHSYDGTGYYRWGGVTTAVQDGTTNQRIALQTLIWCISDPADPASPQPAEQERALTCAASMSLGEQARLLAQIPDTPVISIDLHGVGGTYDLGETAEFELTTNLYLQPIGLGVTGVAGTLSVLSGPAVYDAVTDSLTVTGSDPATSTTVRLGFTTTTAGTVAVTATGTSASRTHLAWNQSPGVALDGKPCQVFATFDTTAEIAVSDSASADFATTVATPAKTQPKIVTRTSRGKVVKGSSIRDRVTISGFRPGGNATGEVSLFGPFASRAAAVCTPATRVATRSFTPRNGTVTTPAVKVRVPGYYTWVATVSADAHNLAATHACGMARETTLVHKRGYGTPRIDTGYAGVDPDLARSAARRLTTRLSYRAVGADATVNGVGIRRKKVEVPGNAAALGMVKRSAALGDKVGTTVVVGHVSNVHGRPGAFYRLSSARKGQIITVLQGNRSHQYRVTGTATYSRAHALPKRLFSTTGRHRLVLVSCTGKVTLPGGRFHYTKNMVVTAVPIS